MFLRLFHHCVGEKEGMPRIRWTLEEDERLLGLIAAGKSWTFISAALRRDTNSVKLHAGTLRARQEERTATRRAGAGGEGKCGRRDCKS
jgi:hypothetical protein